MRTPNDDADEYEQGPSRDVLDNRQVPPNGFSVHSSRASGSSRHSTKSWASISVIEIKKRLPKERLAQELKGALQDR